MPHARPSRSARRDVARLLRAFWRHVTRQRALVAWLIGGTAFVGATVLDFQGAWGRALLVLSGVLLSLGLLPDNPTPFWRVAAADLSLTVPHDALVEAAQKTLEALADQAESPLPMQHRQLLARGVLAQSAGRVQWSWRDQRRHGL